MKKTEEQLRQEKFIKIVQKKSGYRSVKQIMHSENDEPEELDLGKRKTFKSKQSRKATFE